MELKFSDLNTKKEIRKSIDLIVNEDTINLQGEEIKVLEAITFKGKATIADDVITLGGNITAKLELECSRCLNNFSFDVITDIDEKFSNNLKGVTLMTPKQMEEVVEQIDYLKKIVLESINIIQEKLYIGKGDICHCSFLS